MASSGLLENVFWTVPPEVEDARPTDPLGLDAMREELSDHLVPCLTGRTWSHEDFLWTMTLLRWSASEPTERARVQSFLEWERRLKLHWVHKGLSKFAGVEEASKQAEEDDAPSLGYRPLLVNQRSNGLLGAHLAPMRKLGLVDEASYRLTPLGDRLVEGVGKAPELTDGSWSNWQSAFNRVRTAFDRRAKEELPEDHERTDARSKEVA